MSGSSQAEACRNQVEQGSSAQLKALQLVYEVSLQRDVSLASLCEHLANRLSHDLSFDYVGVYSLDGRRRFRAVAEATATQHDGAVAIEPPHAFCRQILAAGATLVVREPAKGQATRESGCHAGPGRFAVLIGTAIKNGNGNVIGVLCAGSRASVAPTSDHERILETLAVFLGHQFEIDSLRQEQAASRRLALLGQLTSGVAHEVRSPLNAILATAEALELDLGADPEYGEYIRQICLQVERLTVLMRDLLDLGKPIRETAREPCLLSNVCAEAVALWRQTSSAQSWQVRISVSAAAASEVPVFIDRVRIHQVVLNLLENAAQHSAAGSEIRVIVAAPGSIGAGFQVVDCGTGLKEQDREHVFEPFFTQRKTGTGLGLSVVKHIVESHGGTVSIRNREDASGCAVEVLLPVAEHI